MNYICLLKTFIRAERTSDWNLNLPSQSQILNLFAELYWALSLHEFRSSIFAAYA